MNSLCRDRTRCIAIYIDITVTCCYFIMAFIEVSFIVKCRKCHSETFSTGIETGESSNNSKKSDKYFMKLLLIKQVAKSLSKAKKRYSQNTKTI